jgi:hypothetical protein
MLRRVDLVHRLLDLRIGVDVGHQRLDDPVAEIVHHVRKLVLHRVGDLVLLLEHIVELVLRHPCPDDVEDERRDLHVSIGQPVEGVVHLLGQHVVLDGDDDVDEHVVFGLGLDLDIELLDPQVNPSGDRFDERDLEVEPGLRDPCKLTEALHDRRRLLLDREERSHEQEDEHERDHAKENVNTHAQAPFRMMGGSFGSTTTSVSRCYSCSQGGYSNTGWPETATSYRFNTSLNLIWKGPSLPP